MKHEKQPFIFCLFDESPLGQTNLIFRFASETWKKVDADWRSKNKNIVNFYNGNSNFESFLTVFVMVC